MKGGKYRIARKSRMCCDTKCKRKASPPMPFWRTTPPNPGKSPLQTPECRRLSRGEDRVGTIILEVDSPAPNLQMLFKFTALTAPSVLLCSYRGTSLTRERTPLGPYRRPVPRELEVHVVAERLEMVHADLLYHENRRGGKVAKLG